jgi:NAD-reducing hydrogenase small subunit
MSFLDMDEFLFDLAARVDIVFSPFVDSKHYPEGVDAVLIEGAVCNEEHLAMVKRVRARTRTVISFGDCAVTGNVTALRNPFGGAETVLDRAYLDGGNHLARIPSEPGIVPVLLDRVVPVHAIIPVEHYIPGCPPPGPRIRAVLESLIEGKAPALTGEEIRFG